MDDQASNNETLRLVVRDEISAALIRHGDGCPFVRQKIDERTRVLEQRVATIWGYIVGAAVVSGGTAAALTRYLPGP
jgi:hypothetical protein